jgi:hypothetical protein
VRSTWKIMIRKFLGLVFVAVLLAGCTTSQPAEKGTVQFTTSPSGAEIYLDNQYRGSTPGTISDIEPGNHTLEFRLNGHKNWGATITVPSGTSNFFASLTSQPGSEGTDISPEATAAAPATVTIRVSRDRMIIGDSNTFSGTATGTSSVFLTLYGPGYYKDGAVLAQTNPDTINAWSYTWNPGTKILSGTYTIVAGDAGKTVTDRARFTVIGGGVVTVTPNSYTVGKGDPLIFSGRCTTGSPEVRLVLAGPDRFIEGVSLGTVSVTADQTWSYRYTTDSTMPTGIYTISVSDVPQTTTGSSQFTLGYNS